MNGADRYARLTAAWGAFRAAVAPLEAVQSEFQAAREAYDWGRAPCLLGATARLRAATRRYSDACAAARLAAVELRAAEQAAKARTHG